MSVADPYTRVGLRVIGVPLRRQVGEPSPDQRTDTPRGIEHLDVDWFVDELTLDALAACKTDEELRALRAKAEMARRLVSLKASAVGRGPGGG